MPARRCSRCALDWPFFDEYKVCQNCEEPTDPIANIKAMPDDEAESLANHYKFERYYANRASANSDPDSSSDTISETLEPS